MSITIREIFDDPKSHHFKYITTLPNNRKITTTVTSSPKVVRKWLSTTLSTCPWFRPRLVIGLGVQWVPTYDSSEEPEAATLNLCVGRKCLVFQLVRSRNVPLSLRRFLEQPSFTFVGMWNHSDEKMLERSRHGLELFRSPLDLRLYVESNETGESLARANRETIVEKCLGYCVRFDHEVSKSDWDDEFLSEDHVLQATLDAHASFSIGKNLKAWKFP